MKAVVFDGNRASVQDVADPIPVPGEALVRVSVAGICNTDLEIVRGYMGFEGILGHEMVGVVEAHPDPAMIGQRVTAEINLPCGTCERCSMGLGRHCPKRTVLGILGKDGCFAEHVTMPIGNLHPVPGGVSDEAAVFTEPLAAAFEILEQLDVPRGARVLVLGDGKLGLLISMVLAHSGVVPTHVGRHLDKLRILEGLGVETMLEAALGDRLFDVVVEATGSPAGLDLALDRVRPRGTVVLKSTFHGAVTVDTAKVVIDELTILGSRCGPFAPALEALAAGTIDPTPLIAETYALSDAEAAIARAGSSGTLKVLLRP
ncbi:MAG: alcohol dehydrogenase [Deltaproteobacteria bacterium]|nr:MAG: alcohol dehydrogenase [Deltaproteobacteria bacterium]